MYPNLNPFQNLNTNKHWSSLVNETKKTKKTHCCVRSFIDTVKGNQNCEYMGKIKKQTTKNNEKFQFRKLI